MIITFAVHGDLIITNELKELLKKTITENMTADTVFYLSGYGNFDMMCATVIRELKADFPFIFSVFVTPYLENQKLEYIKPQKLYDDILYPPLENVPPRFAISKRNEYMVENSDLVICFITHTFGGAYKALKYAKRKKKRIINISN